MNTKLEYMELGEILGFCLGDGGTQAESSPERDGRGSDDFHRHILGTG